MGLAPYTQNTSKLDRGPLLYFTNKADVSLCVHCPSFKVTLLVASVIVHVFTDARKIVLNVLLILLLLISITNVFWQLYYCIFVFLKSFSAILEALFILRNPSGHMFRNKLNTKS